MKSQARPKMGYVWLKTSSLSQILKRPCERSRGHIFSLILVKHCQNVCIDEMSSKVIPVWSKSRSQDIKKNILYALGVACLVQYS